MSDTASNFFVGSGNAATMAGFTPDPASPAAGPDQGYTFFNTDDSTLYAWDGMAWVATGGGGGGDVTASGTLTAGQLVIGDGTTAIDVGDLTGDVTTSGGTATTLKTAAKTRAITCCIDGGGVAITTGIKADVYVPYACTITAVTMLADTTGSIVVDIWGDPLANYPPTDADSITASAVPTITAGTNSQDATLTGWTTAITAGDTLRFNVDSCSAITRLALTLTVTV